MADVTPNPRTKEGREELRSESPGDWFMVGPYEIKDPNPVPVVKLVDENYDYICEVRHPDRFGKPLIAMLLQYPTLLDLADEQAARIAELEAELSRVVGAANARICDVLNDHGLSTQQYPLISSPFLSDGRIHRALAEKEESE